MCCKLDRRCLNAQISSPVGFHTCPKLTFIIFGNFQIKFDYFARYVYFGRGVNMPDDCPNCVGITIAAKLFLLFQFLFLFYNLKSIHLWCIQTIRSIITIELRENRLSSQLILYIFISLASQLPFPCSFTIYLQAALMHTLMPANLYSLMYHNTVPILLSALFFYTFVS